MSDSEKQKEPENLPRLVCAFAGFFALAVPAFSVLAGARAQSALVDVAMRDVYARDELPALSQGILDACAPASWALLAIGIVAALSLFALMRKNSRAGTLVGAGRIVVALGLTAMLSAFYLAAQIFAVALTV